MAQYELMFDVDTLDDGTTERIYAEYDALVSAHADGTTLTITAEGSTASTAAKLIVGALEKLGVTVRRLTEDVVSKGDIALRCEATPQAVGQWIRGKRQRDTPFPPRLHRVLGGVWLWSEVNDWLRRVGKPHDDSVEFPCRRDYDEVNAWLGDREIKRRLTSVHASIRYEKGADLTAGSDFPIGTVQRSRVTLVRE